MSECVAVSISPAHRRTTFAVLLGVSLVDQPDSDDAGGSAAGPAGAQDRRQLSDLDHVARRRDHDANERDDAADRRDRDATERDRAADRRDRDATERDHAADARDQDANTRDLYAERHAKRYTERDAAGTTAEVLDRSAQARRDAAADRQLASRARSDAASERTDAGFDRDASSADRTADASGRLDAGADRDIGRAARHVSAREREHSSRDGLTGALLRDAGLAELEREIARVRRMGHPLVLAFIDVDHLKTVNDSRGHASGDRLLIEVASTLRARLRSYDLVVRFGGDEFLCALPGLSMSAATTRLELVNTMLADGAEHGSITVGLAELQPDDSTADLIARADAQLYRQRH
jgi:diguanylate cyclase (GGDEF)-like protein